MDDTTRKLAIQLKEWFGNPDDCCPMLMWHDFAQSILNAERTRIVGLFDAALKKWWADFPYADDALPDRIERIIEGLRK
jgi:truncated hemoglobin YjbI